MEVLRHDGMTLTAYDLMISSASAPEELPTLSEILEEEAEIVIEKAPRKGTSLLKLP
jgi:hypothetical protein